MNNNEQLFTAEEVARIFRVSVTTVWRKCRDREWPHRMIGRRYLFGDDDLEDIRDIIRPTIVRPIREPLRPIRAGKKIPI